MSTGVPGSSGRGAGALRSPAEKERRRSGLSRWLGQCSRSVGGMGETRRAFSKSQSVLVEQVSS